MLARAAIFVSKRLQGPAAALLCLAAAQLVVAMADGGVPAAGETRVAIQP
jgi:hypothetical protein